ncbi:MAG: hypothetical protein ACOYNN_18830 [Terrimicrobiaceae bacterium]
MFWKRWFKYEAEPLPTVGEFRQLERDLTFANEQLAYQTDLARSFRDRVHELERQLTDKTDLGNIHKLAADDYLADIIRLEKQVAELSLDVQDATKQYNNLLDRVCEIIVDETGDDEPETGEDAEFNGEATAVIDTAKYGGEG